MIRQLKTGGCSPTAPKQQPPAAPKQQPPAVPKQQPSAVPKLKPLAVPKQKPPASPMQQPPHPRLQESRPITFNNLRRLPMKFPPQRTRNPLRSGHGQDGLHT